QAEAAETQPGDQMNEGDLARLALAAEHAFAEKDRADRDTVQATHQHIVAPTFHAVRCTAGEECRVEADDLVVDPGVRPLLARFGTGEDDLPKGAVAADLE